jgi:hypothetical protein
MKLQSIKIIETRNSFDSVVTALFMLVFGEVVVVPVGVDEDVVVETALLSVVVVVGAVDDDELAKICKIQSR